MTIANDIRAFIVENFLFGDTSYALEDHVSLIEADLVDSTGILELVSHVEATYRIDIHDADILPDNFDSIDKIARFVASRSGISQAA